MFLSLCLAAPLIPEPGRDTFQTVRIYGQARPGLYSAAQQKKSVSLKYYVFVTKLRRQMRFPASRWRQAVVPCPRSGRCGNQTDLIAYQLPRHGGIELLFKPQELPAFKAEQHVYRFKNQGFAGNRRRQNLC